MTLRNEPTLLSPSLPGTGGTVTGPVLLQSTSAGGLDTSDSTSRATIQSWQTNGTNFYAEGVRLDLMRGMSKNMIAWRLPRPPTSSDTSTLRSVTWAGAHYYAQDQPDPNNPTVVHGHWSIEVPDSTDALRTRFEIKFVDSSNNLGVDKTLVQTASADLVVDCSNSQVLRLRSGAGAEKAIEWGNDQWGAAPRWKMLQNGTTETGSNVGSDLEVRRYTDAGGSGGSPIRVRRSNGRVTIGDTDGSQTGLDVNRNSTGVTIQATNTATGGTALGFTAQDTTSRALQVAVTGDPGFRAVIYADGKTEWGDGTNARDTNLYRVSADNLKTDDSLTVGANLTVTGTATLSGQPAAITAPNSTSGSYVWTSSPSTTSTSATLGTGTLRLVPWLVQRALTITRIGGEVTVVGDAGSKLRLGIYADNGSCYPGALLLDAGQIAGDSATAQELTVSSLVLQPGLFWIGGALQSVTTTQPTVRIPGSWTPPVLLSTGTGIPAANSTIIGYSMTGVTGALPANFSGTLTAAGSAPRIFVKLT